MAIRSGMDEIKRSIAKHLRTNFDYTKINGLTQQPAITQNPTRQTQTPRIYIYANGQIEIDTSKADVPIEYTVNVEVLVKYNSYRGGNRQAHQMLDEIIGSLRGLRSSDYPTVDGYNIYRIQFGEIVDFKFIEEGQNYYKVICPFHISATQDAVPSTTQPMQAAEFTYSGFTFAPTSTNIERWDSGNIVPATTYPSNNNGWNFETVTYTVATGADGTYSDGNYTIDSDDTTLGITSTINYTNDIDNTITTSLNATTNFDRIDSLRYGAINAQGGSQPTLTDDDATGYGLRNLANWNVDFGVVVPHQATITMTANAGQYLYLIVDHEDTVTHLIDTLGTNNITNFTSSIVGDYKIYLSVNPIYYDNSTFTYIITAN